MHGMASYLFTAEVVLRMALLFLFWISPFPIVGALWWLVGRTDQFFDYVFPHWEWERQLGWLNARAYRRVERALRWLGYCVYGCLVFALYGIAWGAEGLRAIDHWSDPMVLGDLALRVPVLVVALGFWVLYLRLWLFPKLRDEREKLGLEKFRAEMRAVEATQARSPRSRIKPSLARPGKNASLAPDRSRKRF